MFMIQIGLAHHYLISSTLLPSQTLQAYIERTVIQLVSQYPWSHRQFNDNRSSPDHKRTRIQYGIIHLSVSEGMNSHTTAVI